jgi:large subunit ribosomal protein L3
MAGHMGNVRVTTLNLEVVDTDKDRGSCSCGEPCPARREVGFWCVTRSNGSCRRRRPKPGSFRKSEVVADAGAGQVEQKP